MVSPASVLVTGANRGIGLGLVKQLLKNNEIRHVFATARNPDKAEELKRLSSSDPRLHLVELEVDCDKSINEAYSKVEQVVGDNGLNVLVNNAGILIPYVSDQKPDREAVTKTLITNAVSPFILSQTFLPLLKKAANSVAGDELSWNRAAILTITSGLGSVSDNQIGSSPKGFAAYRMSKSAANSFSRNFAIDLKKDHIFTAAFCPGWVQTDMGGSEAAVTVEQSTSGLLNVFAKLTTENTGGYFEYSGRTLNY